MRSFATILVASLPFSALASHLGNHPHRHSDLALRAHNQTLQKRDDRFTYYNIETGVTACGNTYSASDFVSDHYSIYQPTFIHSPSFSGRRAE
ncbi:hypothetical protein BC827DRAFT_448951 [Russula dissimulans]|nr:hypothetical protein BC827DRAFT_448951 [Russula dissimulans]